MTKEELLKQVGELETKISLSKLREEKIKVEFAKAFDWYENKMYDGKEYKKPTWEEIFVKIGKLLADTNTYHLEKQVARLEEEREEYIREKQLELNT